MNEQELDELDDLMERHTELRLRFFSTEEAVAAQRSRLPVGPGCYEWWQFEVFDEDGSGICVGIYNGDPFHPLYRRTIRRHLEEQTTEARMLQPSSFPAVRVSVFEKRNLIARAHRIFHARGMEVSGEGATWSVQTEGVSLSADGRGGWILAIAESGTQRLGFMGFVRPDRRGGRSLKVSLRMEPMFRTVTVGRASMPDSPNGSTHDWLVVCPAGKVTGTIEVGGGEDAGKRKMELREARGTLNQFWGTGLIGHRMRRWYRGTFLWDRGAVVTELPVIQKYIQLAGTLMYFSPGAVPRIVRCAHQRSTTFQRSSWLLAHPLSMKWGSTGEGVGITFPVKGLNDAQPFRGMALCETEFSMEAEGEDFSSGACLGMIEILQPGRADWWLWRRYLCGGD